MGNINGIVHKTAYYKVLQTIFAKNTSVRIKMRIFVKSQACPKQIQFPS